MRSLASSVASTSTVVTATAGGRLSFSNSLAVTTADQIAQSTIYCMPYAGRDLALWNGTAWVYATIPDTGTPGVSISTVADATKPYDVFGFLNAGAINLEIGPVWSSTVLRATNATIQDGTLCKSGDKTRRYLGTFMPSGGTPGVSVVSEDSIANRYLWNMYNRVPRRMLAQDTSASQYAYTTASFRASNANTAAGQGRFNFVIGQADVLVRAQNVNGMSNSTSTNLCGGICLDNTNANNADVIFGQANPTNALSVSIYQGWPSTGQHFLQRVEFSNATGTTVWNLFAANLFSAAMEGWLLG